MSKTRGEHIGVIYLMPLVVRSACDSPIKASAHFIGKEGDNGKSGKSLVPGL